MNRRFIIWALILAFISILLMFVPGFNALSFYFSMPIAAVLGMACGGLAVTVVSQTSDAFQAMRKTLIITSVLAAIPLIIASVGSLITGPCNYLYALGFYLMGPLVSAIFGAALGFAVGLLVPDSRIKGAIVPIIFAASFVPNLLDLYFQPAVFFFNPFLGYYPGPIYDDLIKISASYVTFRLFCLTLAIALVSFALILPDLLRKRRINKVWAVVFVVSVLATTIVGINAGNLGFRVTRNEVKSKLNSTISSDYCEIHHSGGLDQSVTQRLLWECGYQHRRIANYFGLQAGDPIQVYLYPDVETKAKFMGARHVEISKPWLNEIHVTESVLGDFIFAHELAHVIAGRLAPGFLALPVRYHFLPDMAVVEGLAVAASFFNDGPSSHEWAIALILAEVKVDPVALFKPGVFISSGAGTAYTVAGSIVAWIGQRFGVQALQELARGNGFAAATGHELVDLVPMWRDFLDAEIKPTIDPHLIERARGRFADLGVLRRRCPTDVARALDMVDSAYRIGDLKAAQHYLEIARQYDPELKPLVRESIRVSACMNDEGTASMLTNLLNLKGGNPTPQDRLVAVDAWLLDAVPTDLLSPREQLLLALDDVKSGPEARAICVRLMALGLPQEQRQVIVKALISHGLDLALVSLQSAPSDLARYILARIGLWKGNFTKAATLFEDLYLKNWPSDEAPAVCQPLFDGQIALLGARAAFWMGDFALTKALLDSVDEGQFYGGEILTAQAYRDRIDVAQQDNPSWIPSSHSVP